MARFFPNADDTQAINLDLIVKVSRASENALRFYTAESNESVAAFVYSDNQKRDNAYFEVVRSFNY